MLNISDVGTGVDGGIGFASAEHELVSQPVSHVCCLWLQAAFNRRIGSEVPLHGTQATVLDRSAPLDDAGNRGGPIIGRVLKGVPYERARCLRGIPLLSQSLDAGAHRSSPNRHPRKAAKRLPECPTRH